MIIHLYDKYGKNISNSSFCHPVDKISRHTLEIEPVSNTKCNCVSYFEIYPSFLADKTVAHTYSLKNVRERCIKLSALTQKFKYQKLECVVLFYNKNNRVIFKREFKEINQDKLYRVNFTDMVCNGCDTDFIDKVARNSEILWDGFRPYVPGRKVVVSSCIHRQTEPGEISSEDMSVMKCSKSQVNGDNRISKVELYCRGKKIQKLGRADYLYVTYY